jgi:proliferating cell nuclear antigen PCNA
MYCNSILNMLTLTLNNDASIVKFVNIFRHLRNVVSDANIVITSDRLYIQGMDSSHVCLVEVSLKNTWFNSLIITDDELLLGVNCETLFTILNFWKTGYNIEFSMDSTDVLKIQYKGDSMVTRSYEMPLMDIYNEPMDIPEKEPDVSIIIDSSEFKNMMQELSTFGDELIIRNNNDTDDPDNVYLVFQSSGEIGKATILIREEDIIEYTETVENPFKIKLGTNFIVMSSEFHKVSDETRMYISTKELPIKIEYLLDNDAPENFIRIYIAPKVDD